MKKLFISIEMTDGTAHENLRIFAADRVRASEIARTNSVPWEDTPKCHALLGYCTVKRLGLTDAPDFDTWMDNVVDFSLSNDAPDFADPTTQTA